MCIDINNSFNIDNDIMMLLSLIMEVKVNIYLYVKHFFN